MTRDSKPYSIQSLILFFVFLPHLVAHAGPFQDQMVQKSQLSAPSRGSLAGEFGSTRWSASDLTRGTYSLSIGLQFPSDRGPMVYLLDPKYSPSNGISEWGMGVNAELSIRRYRASGILDFVNDDLMSPWGQLVRGDDGDYYPLNLSPPIRVRFVSAKQILAFLPDGSVLTFGRDTYLETPSGIYSWYLVEAKNAKEQYTTYEYDRSRANYFYLTCIFYGGSKDNFQYQVKIHYDNSSSPPFVDFRSTIRQDLTRRVTMVSLQSKTSGRSGSFEDRYDYVLEYESSKSSPAFYLKTLVKQFGFLQAEPDRTFSYHRIADFFQDAKWTPIEKLKPVLDQIGTGLLDPDRGASVDPDVNGLTSVETLLDQFSLIRQDEKGFFIEKLGSFPSDGNPLCRQGGLAASPRNLLRLRGFESPIEVLWMYLDSSRTRVISCTREGKQTGELLLPTDWTLGSTTRLVDLNRDGKPDLIRVHAGKYQILQNISTDEKLQFSPDIVEGTLGKDFKEYDMPKAIYLQDLNGDGILDLVGRNSSEIVVWYGKGGLQFESERVRMPIYDLAGRLWEIRDSELYFEDLNGDGIADLVAYGKDSVRVFLSDGTQFRQVFVPALENKAMPSRELVSRTLVPVLGDFLGSGNPQITTADSKMAYALEFTGPQSGLLKTADDGKGNRIHFEYTRAKPEKGAGARTRVVNRVRFQRTGKADETVRYHFSKAKTHSANHAFLGFAQVKIEEKSFESENEFEHSDLIPSLFKRGRELDPRIPGVFRIQEKDYKKTAFQGIPYQQVVSEKKGWREEGGESALIEKSFEQYQGFCPSIVREKLGASTLITRTEHKLPEGLAGSLGCFASEILLAGTHPKEFKHGLRIKRDSLGNPELLTSLGSQNHVLQEIKYRSDYRVESISVPGKGTNRFAYDENFRLNGIIQPDGVEVQATRAPIRDWVTSLSTLHGESGVYLQGFEYDSLERLSKQWDNLFASSSNNPLVEFHYQYATHTQPGWVETSYRIGEGKTPALKKEATLFAADGQELTSGPLGDEGWALKTTNRFLPEERETQLLQPRTVRGELASLDEKGLFENLASIGTEVKSSLDTPLEKIVVHQKGRSGKRVTRAEVVQGALQLTHTENSKYTTVERLDPRGKRIWYQDAEEEKNVTQFGYDSLGRFVGVQLANGTNHRVIFDEHGRVGQVLRAKLGGVEYEYAPGTELVKTKTYLDRKKKPARRVAYEYDSAGRVTIQTQTLVKADGSLGEVQKYLYFYDGKVPQGKVIPDQVGFLTAIQGPAFTRVSIYRPDGKPKTVEVRWKQWGTLKQTLDYYGDGSLKLKDTEWVDPSSNKPVRLIQSNLYDSRGRLSEMKVDKTTLLSLAYNPFSQVEKVTYPSSEGGILRYEELTRKLQGYSFSTKPGGFSVGWEWNERGFLASEDFTLGKDGLARKLDYSPNGFLSEETDKLDKRVYSYDAIGMLTGVQAGNQKRELGYNSKEWWIKTKESNSIYTLDSAGRVIRTPSVTFGYGPSGRVERVESKGQAAAVSYAYDEAGKRVLKRTPEGVLEGYWDGLVLKAGHIIQQVQVKGVLLGVLDNEVWTPIPADVRGTVFAGADGKLSPVTAYGERKGSRNDLAVVADYAARPYDAHLQANTMESRDYDSISMRFLTPDPLFLEEPEKCVESPVECNLYGYGAGNPVSYVDPTGKSILAFEFGLQGAAWGSSLGPVGTAFGAAAGITVGTLATLYGLEKLENALNTLQNASTDAAIGRGESATGVQADTVTEVECPRARYPESAQHIDDAIAAGHPDALTIDRSNAQANRKEAQSGHPRVNGKDRDEYPPAVAKEGGQGASVRPISPSDNRGWGASMGKQIKNLPDGAKIKIKVVD